MQMFPTQSVLFMNWRTNGKVREFHENGQSVHEIEKTTVRTEQI